MSLLDRQRAIRSADAALREVDLPLYADVVVALHRLQEAVDTLSAQWDRKTGNPLIRRVMHNAIEAKDLVACFQENPVTYERMRKQARQEVTRLIEFARLSAPSPGRPPDIRRIEGDIDF